MTGLFGDRAVAEQGFKLTGPFVAAMQGHFQIVLNNDHCPLFQKDLSWFQRLMYCSGVWAYIVGAITTPMFIVIPLVSHQCLSSLWPVTSVYRASVVVVQYSTHHDVSTFIGAVVHAVCQVHRQLRSRTQPPCCKPKAAE